MRRSEIVEGLRSASLWLPLVPGEKIPERAAIEAAIAALTPEPITEDGLRGLGFEDGLTVSSLMLKLGNGGDLVWSVSGDFLLWTAMGDPVPFHGITDMQHLKAVIAAMEGKA